MLSLVSAFTIAASFFEGLASLFGDDGITQEEMKEALDEAVNEIESIVTMLIEWSEWQSARTDLEITQNDAWEYWRYREASAGPLLEQLELLEPLENSSKNSYWSSNNGLDLIDRTVQNRIGAITGEDLLGHSLFMIAAGLRHMVLEEKMRIYANHGSSDFEEVARQNLITTLDISIDTARKMQSEWLAWTEDRFTSLKLREAWQNISVKKYRWVFWFTGRKIIAHEVFFNIFEDDPAKITQGYMVAVSVRMNYINQEIGRVLQEIVYPSEQVVLEWDRALRSLQGLKKGKIDQACMRIEHAMKTAYGAHELSTEVFLSAHPEQNAERSDSARKAKPSLIGKRSLTRKRSSKKRT